jgi:hypothetical protein
MMFSLNNFRVLQVPFMQFFIKCISTLALILQMTINSSAVCICNHKSTDTFSHEHSCHSHSRHENLYSPIDHEDCCCDLHKHDFIKAISQLNIPQDENLNSPFCHSLISFQTASSTRLNSNVRCNSYADTIRLRTEICLI